MSVLTIQKRPAKKMATQKAESLVITPSRRLSLHDEAPDRGDRPHEAPEARLARSAEAPDAGYRRSHCDEGSFHGRSSR